MRTWTLPCACGRDVTANRDDPTPGVSDHNATPEHLAWRDYMELRTRRHLAVIRSREYRQRQAADVVRLRLERSVA